MRHKRIKSGVFAKIAVPCDKQKKKRNGPVAPWMTFKILLVEDNIENQKVTMQILEKAGFAVEIAENGKKAVKAAGKYQYSVILMDIQMPVMDGFEATRSIRGSERERGGERTPIIALTACALKGYRKKCLETGMDDYLSKPVNKGALLEALDRWIDRRPSVLIVDDVEDNRKLVEKYLSKGGCYRAVLAKNGIEAIAAYRNQALSLILMDVEMPVMDGYAAVRIIREFEEVPTLPIIAMTSHEGPEEIRRCTRAGFTAYIRKPMKENELLAAVGKYLGKGTVTGNNAARQEDVVVCSDPDLAGLIPEYLENRRRDVREIGRFLREGNFHEIQNIGHKMKGSGGGYGFDGITQMGGEIEEAAGKGEKETVSGLMKRLNEYLSQVKVVHNIADKV